MSALKPQKLAELRKRLHALEGFTPKLEARGSNYVTTRLGLSAIDEALPWNGLLNDGLHEVTGTSQDAAAHGFAAVILGRILQSRGHLLWCRVKRSAFDNGVPYGPGLARFGLDTSRIVFTETENVSDALWAMEEGLRTPGLVAVYGEGIVLDLTSSRRLQLAAESNRKTALALVSLQKCSSITAALTRWHITAVPSMTRDNGPRSRWSLALTRCRGGNTHSWIVEWDHETHGFDLAAPLADGLLEATAS